MLFVRRWSHASASNDLTLGESLSPPGGSQDQQGFRRPISSMQEQSCSPAEEKPLAQALRAGRPPLLRGWAHQATTAPKCTCTLRGHNCAGCSGKSRESP